MLEPVALIYRLNNGLIDRSLDGLSDEEVWRQPGGTGNPIAWLLGHLTETRWSAIRELGIPFEPDWERRFSRGSNLASPAEYPSRTAIEAAWRATRRRMRDGFARLDAERVAAAPAGRPFTGVTTLGEQLAALAFHESYHVGQIGYIRKLLGHSAVAG